MYLRPSIMRQFLPRFRCALFFALALNAIVNLPSSVLADNATPILSNEIWDATTMDINGELTSLNGTWLFEAWDKLDVMPDFAGAKPTQVPLAATPGAYRRMFPVNSEVGTRRVILHFGAIGYRAAVFVNGQEMGTHSGAYTPFQFDVTDVVQRGENELTVLVLGLSGAQLSSEPQPKVGELGFNERGQATATGGNKLVMGRGYWPREGIRQNISVREVPLLRVADATITTSVRKKEFAASINIANQSTPDRRLELQVDVRPYNIAAKTIGATPVWTASQTVEAKAGFSTVSFARPWSNPQLWMPGDPHLYVAKFQLLDPATRGVLHERNVRFGFREIWTEGHKIILNGKPFRAYAHFTLDTDASPEKVREIFKNVQDVGINIIRPVSMPPAPYFCQIADEMGMGVIGEGELTFNMNYAYEQPIFWQNFERLMAERIARDKNHPSILMWSTGNEVICTSPGAKIGHLFHAGYERLRVIDPTRPFMQEGDGDLRDLRPDATPNPMDIINLHLYDVSPTKNPLWATEFPSVAWAVDSIKTNSEMPGTIKSGVELPDRNRPWFIGEFGPNALYAYPDFFSFWTGPEAYRDLFGGADKLVQSVGETVLMQLQGFRDMDMAGMNPWHAPQDPAYKKFMLRAFEPLTIISRDMRAHGFSGQKMERELSVLNDSFEVENLSLVHIVKQGEREIYRDTQKFALKPGEKRVVKTQFSAPKVQAKTALAWQVQLQDSAGKRVSGIDETWHVYPQLKPAAAWREGRAWLVGTNAELGALAKWSAGVLRPAAELKELNVAKVSVVVVGPSAYASLGAEAETVLAPFIKSGGVVLTLGVDKIALDDMSLTSNHESVSTRTFNLRPSTLTRGTTNADWQFWQPDHFVSRDNYEMSFDPRYEFPIAGGGRNGVMYSPLAVLPMGAGALVGCRLQLNEAIESEPVAQLFLNNLVAYAAERAVVAKENRNTQLVLFASEAQTAAWKTKLQQARIPTEETNTGVLQPDQHIVLLTGDATPTAAQVARIEKFVTAGGTLWLHRLTPQTPFLAQVLKWTGSSFKLKKPEMWLQQFELVSPANPPALLAGINDFHTAWATFGYTNGDMFSVKTTPIADYSLTDLGPNAVALLKEPDFIGKWDLGVHNGSLSEKIMRGLNTHPRNQNPGVGLAEYSAGRGRIVIDQLRWDEAMNDEASTVKFKARYFGGTLWKNLSQRGGGRL
jgi:hypothetical protein